MLIDARLPGPCGTMLKRDIYKDATNLYLRYSKKPATIIDGGACQGLMISMFNSLLPRSTIHGFEANPKLFSDLTKRFKANKNIILHNNILSDSVGLTKFCVSDYFPSGSILEPTDWLIRICGDKVKVKEVIDLPAVTLDSVLDHADIMKLDVQGAELKVLKGSINLLRTIKVVILEVLFVDYYKEQPLFFDLHSFMCEQNFQMFGLYNLSTCIDGNLVAADALFFNLDFYNKL